jgi:hypothetical protein
LYRVRNPFEALPGFEGLAEGVGLKSQEEPKRKNPSPQGNELLNFGNLTKTIMYTFFKKN